MTNAIRVAVAGGGYWGKNLVRNFAELGALAAIVDPDAANAAPLAQKHGVKVMEWDDVLADDGIAGVAIAAPAALHFTLAQEALKAGKHVFVEKPLALSLEDARELVGLSRAAGRTLMVGHLMQYHPAFLKLLELVRAGRLGRLEYVYSNRLNLGKVRREEDILWSFAPHDISMILALVGEMPDQVDAHGAAYLHARIADVTTTHLSFPSGVHAHIFVSWLHPYKEQKLVLVGEKAMAVFNDGESWDKKLLLYPHSIEWQGQMPVPHKAEAEPVALTEAEPLRAECAHFIECAGTGAPARTDGAEGLRVLQVLHAATAALSGAPAPKLRADRPPGVHETAYVDDNVEIGQGTRIWHFSHLLPGTRLGRDCSVGQNVMIGPDVRVGDRCKIQNNVSLYKGVELEDEVFCGPSCVFTNVNNPRAGVERKDQFRKTLVRRGASIGANATIVCGHDLGQYCFIAAGAVVTGHVPDFALMAGVPARRIGWMSRHGERLGPDLVCPATGTKYRETAPDRLEEIT